MRAIFLASLILFAAPLLAQSEVDAPDAVGYVTSPAAKDLRVLGQKIDITPKTKFVLVTGKRLTRLPAQPEWRLGELLEIWGSLKKKTHSVKAESIHILIPTPHAISGSGIIQKAESAAAGEAQLRADGYQLHLTAKTHLLSAGLIQTLAAAAPNQWIDYRGILEPDGIVDVTEATITPNVAAPSDLKYRAKEDAVARPDSADPTLQARVNRIGTSLIPRYETQLPDTDPTKIQFRFPVTDEEHAKRGRNLQNGVILVSAAALARMQTDSEIAALLADGIAATLEMNELGNHAAGYTRASTILNDTAAAALIVVEPLSAIWLAPGLIRGPYQLSHAQEQSGRESLGLLADAGYDLREAPLAWWLLASKDPQPVEKIPIPLRSINLYKEIGLSWPTKIQPTETP
jgi:hypothetical protein